MRVEETVLRAQVRTETVCADHLLADPDKLISGQVWGADHRVGAAVLLPVRAEPFTGERQVGCYPLVHLAAQLGALIRVVDRYLRVVDPGLADEPLSLRDRLAVLPRQADHQERLHGDPVVLAVAHAR